MPKSPDAFRTISEVADWLGIQAHVLRFWESKFTQVKPIKRAGGRRYYRPADMMLLGGIKKLLHDDGLTIKGVQKILREDGMNHVASMSPPLDEADLDMQVLADPGLASAPTPEPEPQAVVLPFGSPKEAVTAAPEMPEPVTEPEVTGEPEPVVEPEVVAEAEPVSAVESEPKQAAQVGQTPDGVEQSEAPAPEAKDTAPVPDRAEMPEEAAGGASPEKAQATGTTAVAATEDAQPHAAADPTPAATGAAQDEHAASVSDPEAQAPESAAPDARKEEPEAAPGDPDGEDEARETLGSPAAAPDAAPEQRPETVLAATPEDTHADEKEETAEPLPSFLRRPLEASAPATVEAANDPEPSPPAAKARDIGMPSVTPEHEIHAEAAALTCAYRARRFDHDSARKAQPLLAQLATLRDRMSERHGGMPPNT
jgi:DNA-binding transcriptional MerR regulator